MSQVRREADEVIGRAIDMMMDCLCGVRLPAPDVSGILADLQIRQPQLDIVAQHVSEQWPNVVVVRFGYFSSSKQLYCEIHMDSFSHDQQEAYWPLGDWIIETLALKDCIFCILGPAYKEDYWNCKVEVYKRSIPEV